MLMFLCPVHFFPCRPPMTSSDLLLLLLLLPKLENRIPKVDLPEIKGNHRKFRNLVTSYIGNSVYVCVCPSVHFCANVCTFVLSFFLSYDPVCLFVYVHLLTNLTIRLSRSVSCFYSIHGLLFFFFSFFRPSPRKFCTSNERNVKSDREISR